MTVYTVLGVIGGAIIGQIIGHLLMLAYMKRKAQK